MHFNFLQKKLPTNYFKCEIIPQFQFQIHHQGQQFLLQKEQTRLSCKTKQIYRSFNTLQEILILLLKFKNANKFSI